MAVMNGQELVAAIQAVDGWPTRQVLFQTDIVEGSAITEEAEDVWIELRSGAIVISAW